MLVVCLILDKLDEVLGLAGLYLQLAALKSSYNTTSS